MAPPLTEAEYSKLVLHYEALGLTVASLKPPLPPPSDGGEPTPPGQFEMLHYMRLSDYRDTAHFRSSWDCDFHPVANHAVVLTPERDLQFEVRPGDKASPQGGGRAEVRTDWKTQPGRGYIYRYRVRRKMPTAAEFLGGGTWGRSRRILLQWHSGGGTESSPVLGTRNFDGQRIAIYRESNQQAVEIGPNGQRLWLPHPLARDLIETWTIYWTNHVSGWFDYELTDTFTGEVIALHHYDGATMQNVATVCDLKVGIYGRVSEASKYRIADGPAGHPLLNGIAMSMERLVAA